MIGIGIALAILGYAVIYSAVMDFTGRPTGVIEVLKPGFVPKPAPTNTRLLA